MRVFVLAFMLATMSNAMECYRCSNIHKIDFKQLLAENTAANAREKDLYTFYEGKIKANVTLSLNPKTFYILDTNNVGHALYEINRDTGAFCSGRSIESDQEKDEVMNGIGGIFFNDVMDRMVSLSEIPKKLNISEVRKVIRLDDCYLVFYKSPKIAIANAKGEIQLQFGLIGTPLVSELIIFSNGDFALLVKNFPGESAIYLGRKVPQN